MGSGGRYRGASAYQAAAPAAAASRRQQQGTPDWPPRPTLTEGYLANSRPHSTFSQGSSSPHTTLTGTPTACGAEAGVYMREGEQDQSPSAAVEMHCSAGQCRGAFCRPTPHDKHLTPPHPPQNHITAQPETLKTRA
jgi:hypothetical protein